MTPAELVGADYVLMFNDDKTAGETDVTYTVTLSRAATVFLTCDDRITDQQAAVDRGGGGVCQTRAVQEHRPEDLHP